MTLHQSEDPCVLIVDDEKDVRESVRDVVEMLGCRAVLAKSGEEGLSILGHMMPCLVVLDLTMPGMGGLAMLTAIRSQPALLNLAVLISTSAPERAPRGVPLLPKPVDFDALCAWITKLCHCEQTTS